MWTFIFCSKILKLSYIQTDQQKNIPQNIVSSFMYKERFSQWLAMLIYNYSDVSEKNKTINHV